MIKKIEELTVTELIDSSYKEYSLYVLQQRAIPSCIDGLKPVQRKALYTISRVANTQLKRMSEIGSSLSSVAGYVHGDSSAIDTCVKMGQTWKNQFSLVQGEGNFGSRLVQQAAAPRYIHGRLNPEVKKYFLDNEIAPVHPDGEDHPEPIHYLPIIPWVLVNGTEGIAVGFSCSILPRRIDGLVKQVKNHLKGKKVSSVELSYPCYRGEIKKSPTGWVSHGIFEEGKRNDIIITEVPIGWDRLGYVTHLNNLCDQNRINDYEDRCSKEGFSFVLKCSKDQKNWLLANPATRLGMEKKISENLTTIDEKGKLRIFESDVELIKHFTDVRLSFYQKRKDYQIDKLCMNIDSLQRRAEFIKIVLKRNMRSLTKADLEEIAVEVGEPEPKVLVGIPLYNCSKDEVDSLNKKISDLKIELDHVMALVPVDMYLADLDAVS